MFSFDRFPRRIGQGRFFSAEQNAAVIIFEFVVQMFMGIRIEHPEETIRTGEDPRRFPLTSAVAEFFALKIVSPVD